MRTEYSFRMNWPDSNSDLKSGKREQVLDAALALMAERGFHGTTMPEVAERANVGAGTLYRYFTNKEALVNAVFRGCKSEMGRVLMTDFPLGQPLRAQFAEMWRRLWLFAEREPHALSFLELHHHATYLDAESLAVDLAVLGPLVAFVRMGQDAQILKAGPPELILTIVWGVFSGTMRAGQLGHLVIDPQVIALAEAWVWEAIRR